MDRQYTSKESTPSRTTSNKLRRGSTLIGTDFSKIEEWDLETMEKVLKSRLVNGVVGDIEETHMDSLANPGALAHFKHLPVKLWLSPVVAQVFKAALAQKLPGTSVSYGDVVDAINQYSSDSFCFVHGGQVRDMLTGKVSKDVDITYSCKAKEVAMLCVERGWPTNFKAIGVEGEPNYVMIGEEQSGLYMEGFSLDFSITAPIHKQDFRRNMLIYDPSNDIIIDKTGYGVQDLLTNTLRFSCAPNQELWEDWAREESTVGEKGLRYVKFLTRAQLRGMPLTIDDEENSFVAAKLQIALRDNPEALRQFWFGYLLGECLSSQEGLHALHTWVCSHNIPSCWDEWIPFVRPLVVDATWLTSVSPRSSSGVDIVREGLADTDGHVMADRKSVV